VLFWVPTPYPLFERRFFINAATPLHMLKKLLLLASLLHVGSAQAQVANGLTPGAPLNDLKIVYFGSSVPFGQGATNKYGYTARYSTQLARRAAAGQGAPWVTANISISGNSTVQVLERWDRDLVPQQARYVIYALALGNEGIHTEGQPKFDQFKTNMQKLIAMAREKGMVPVVTNSYTRNDYTATDYAFIKQMNLLLHAWVVPTVNLLGAVDDGRGH
jgi:lysophospholipase L1-like esterase